MLGTETQESRENRLLSPAGERCSDLSSRCPCRPVTQVVCFQWSACVDGVQVRLQLSHPHLGSVEGAAREPRRSCSLSEDRKVLLSERCLHFMVSHFMVSHFSQFGEGLSVLLSVYRIPPACYRRQSVEVHRLQTRLRLSSAFG